MTYIEVLDKIINKHGNVGSVANDVYARYSNGKLNTEPHSGIFSYGKFYIFNYADAEMLSSVNKNQKLYYDHRPFIFGLNYRPDSKILKGINFNVMPAPAKKRFFNFVHNTCCKNKDSNEFPIFDSIPIHDKNLNKVYNLKSNIAINNYKREHIKNIRVIDLEEFPYLLFLNTNSVAYSKKMSSSFIKKQL